MKNKSAQEALRVCKNIVFLCCCHNKIFDSLSVARSFHAYNGFLSFRAIEEKCGAFVLIICRITAKVLSCGQIDEGYLVAQEHPNFPNEYSKWKCPVIIYDQPQYFCVELFPALFRNKIIVTEEHVAELLDKGYVCNLEWPEQMPFA